MRCEFCRYWDASIQDPASEVDTTGLCRRALPVPDERNGKACWPMTEDCDWCGWFQAMPETKPAETTVVDLLRTAVAVHGSSEPDLVRVQLVDPDDAETLIRAIADLSGCDNGGG